MDLYPGAIVTFVMEDRSERAAVITEVLRGGDVPLFNVEVWLRPDEQQWFELALPTGEVKILYHKTSTRMRVTYSSRSEPGTLHLKRS